MYKHSVLPMTDWLGIFLIFSTKIVCPFRSRWHPRSTPKCHARKNIPRQGELTATGRHVKLCKGGKDKESIAKNLNIKNLGQLLLKLYQLMVFELFDARILWKFVEVFRINLAFSGDDPVCRGCSGEELAPRKARKCCDGRWILNLIPSVECRLLKTPTVVACWPCWHM